MMTVTCGTCKKQQIVTELSTEAREVEMLGFHICDECYNAFLIDFGLEGIIPMRRITNASVALSKV